MSFGPVQMPFGIAEVSASNAVIQDSMHRRCTAYTLLLNASYATNIPSSLTLSLALVHSMEMSQVRPQG